MTRCASWIAGMLAWVPAAATADLPLDLAGPDGSVRFRLAADPEGHLVWSGKRATAAGR